MIDHDAARTDLHADRPHTVPPDPRPIPPARCPRCARDVPSDHLIPADTIALAIIDPFYDRYAPHASGKAVTLCDACDRQLDEISDALLAYRRRLTRLWPRPTAPRGRLMDDQRLSRTFEEIRDTAIEDVLGWAIWYDRRGHDTYLIVYETGEWAIQPVPRGQGYDDLDERGYLALPIPVAPRAADARGEEDDEDDEEAAGAPLRALDLAAFYRHHALSDAEHAALERDLATRFYRTLYTQTGDSA